MRIIHFKGTKIHEYLTIDIDFNNDLSIVTGSNGSGKTTAIMLLQALLCPNVKDLITIPFDTLELKISHLDIEYQISALSKNNKIVLHINSIEDTLEIEKLRFDEIEYINHKEKEDPANQIIKNLSNHPILTFIKSLPSPIFIGLERRTDEIQNEREDYILERRMFLNKSRHEFADYKRQFKGTLGVSLLETEFLVQAIYKRLKQIEDGYTNAIQKELLLSSFDYIHFDPMTDMIETYQEKKKLLSRRQEIEEALKKIGYDNQNFSTKLNTFFQKLEALIDSLGPNNTGGGITIEWLTNQSQIDKLSRLVEIIDDYNSRVNKAFKPINKFIDVLNSYLNDTGKTLYIDKVGHLFIRRPNGRDVSIDALSSGERQIVILFANVMFNKYTSEGKQNILIIDEPELSLHIRWQEKFIDTLLTVSDNTQFILATHSPDIVGDHKSKGVRINKNKQNV